MRTNLTKEEFIAKTEKRIEARKMIIEFYENVYLPMMCLKFNGKVYNIRFIKALREEAAKISELFYISEMKWGQEIEISLRTDKWNYNDTETLYVKCALNGEGRIDYEATVNNKEGKLWLDNFNNYTDTYKDVLEKYDEFMKVADELESAAEKYNKLPYAFRCNIDKNWLYIS